MLSAQYAAGGYSSGQAVLKSHLTSSREEAGYGQACGLLSYSCYLHYTNRYLHSIGRAAQPLSQVIFISDFYAVSLYLLPGFYGVPVSLPHSFLQWSLPYSSLQWSLHYSSLQWSCSVFSSVHSWDTRTNYRTEGVKWTVPSNDCMHLLWPSDRTL